MRTVTDSSTALGRWAIDELLERYVSWREECRTVRLVYLHMKTCSTPAPAGIGR
jgi:hypothetical protein